MTTPYPRAISYGLRKRREQLAEVMDQSTRSLADLNISSDAPPPSSPGSPPASFGTRSAAVTSGSSVTTSKSAATKAPPTPEPVDELVEGMRRLSMREQSRFFSENVKLRNAMISALHDHEGRKEEELKKKEVPSWCTCRRCPLNGFPDEIECCGEQFPRCVTTEPVFVNHVIDRDALLLSMQHRNDIYGNEDDGSQPTQFRHHGYRNYVYWRYGRLGRGNRIILPACVYRSLRTEYWQPDGLFTFYKDGDDNQRRMRHN